MERFCWWLENEAALSPTIDALSPATVRTFLAYAREPHPEGRYGSSRESAKREAPPATISAYFRCLRAFANFCIAEGLLEETPLKNVKAPRVPTDQIQPFDQEQVQAVLNAARGTITPERDVSLILMLGDTGMRVSELLGLTMTDVDRGTGELKVVGQGDLIFLTKPN
jgi:site-specific recombinase XerD